MYKKGLENSNSDALLRLSLKYESKGLKDNENDQFVNIIDNLLVSKMDLKITYQQDI